MRDCAQHSIACNDSHIDAMHRIMKYCLDTKERGTTLNPNEKWDGSKDFKFKIGGRSNSVYTADPETHRSITSTRVSSNRASVMWYSATQKFTTLSLTEAESGAGVIYVQDMVHMNNVIESLGLTVELPMILEIENYG